MLISMSFLLKGQSFQNVLLTIYHRLAIMRKKGLNAYYTNGKTANRPLYRAFTATEGKIQSVAERCFSNIGGGGSSSGGGSYSVKDFIKDVKTKTDELETAMDDPSSLAPQPHMPSIPHAKKANITKSKDTKDSEESEVMKQDRQSEMIVCSFFCLGGMIRMKEGVCYAVR